MSEVCVEMTAEIGIDGQDGTVPPVPVVVVGDENSTMNMMNAVVDGVQNVMVCTVSIAGPDDDTKIIINPPSDSIDVAASGDHPEAEQSQSPLGLPSSKDGKLRLSAPMLRVEQIKDEASEDDTGSEGPNLSQAEISDQDLSGKESKTGDDFPIPDDELSNKIVTQVEFYFSDVNILKDAFLLKHVRRNKQGYVSIKLITSFKKVKSLSRDFRVVAYCLRKSPNLQVNEEGTKVRRIDALPDFDETTPSRTVVAVNLPLEYPTIETIAEMFRECGEIALIRILRPGKTIPGDIKKYSNKHPEIGTTVCAVVEFENHESALKACEMGKDDWRNGLRVVVLSSKKKDKAVKGEKKEKQKDKEKDQTKNPQMKDMSKAEVEEMKETNEVVVMLETDESKPGADGDKESQESVSPKPVEGGSGKKSRNKTKNKNRHSFASDGGASSGSEMDQTNSPSDRDMNWRSSLSPGRCIDKSKLSPASTPGSSPRVSPRSSPRSKRRNATTKSSPLAEGLSPRQSPKPSPMSSPEALRRNRESPGGDNAVSPSGSPWVQRRLKAAQEMSPLAADGSPVGSPLLGRRNLTTEGVIRQPKGPDGTKGFHAGVGRGKLVIPEDV